MPNASRICPETSGACACATARDRQRPGSGVWRQVLPLVGGLAWLAVPLSAMAQSDVMTAPYFNKTIRPLIENYCLKCHSTEKHKGDLDLQRFTSLEEIKRQPKVWQNVNEQLALGEMPPNDKPQPTA